MAETLTIQIPDSPQERLEILKFLNDKGLVRDMPSPSGKSKWALLAEELAEANALGDGLGDILRAGTREFRENFVFKSELSPDEPL